jgi:hypothetical protein
MSSAPRPLLSLLYRSRATAPISADELVSLSSDAQARNRLRHVTGALLYSDGQFFHWLEGPEDSVMRTFERIDGDPRHTDIEVIAAGPLTTRIFSDWGLRLYNRRSDLPPTVHLAEPCYQCNSEPCTSRDVASMLLAGDRSGLRSALDGSAGHIDAMVCYFEKLLGVFAELWSDDECSAADLTIGRAIALSTLREFVVTRAHVPWPLTPDPVLVMPLPGQPNFLRAELATLTLSNAGYPAVYQLPDCGTALADELEEMPYRALVFVGKATALTDREQKELDRLCEIARLCARDNFRIAYYGQDRDESRRPSGPDYRTVTALSLPDFLDHRLRFVHEQPDQLN